MTSFVQRRNRPRRPNPCCPCTNLLLNAGFDLSTDGTTPPPFWTGTGEVDRDVFHNGTFVNGFPSFASALMNVGEHVCQRVAVTPGCCYRLSFAAVLVSDAEPTDNFGVASVEFSTAPPTAQTCLPPAVISPPFGDQLLIPGQDDVENGEFPTHTLEVCAPLNAQSACICFQNRTTGGDAVASTFNVDNVVFSVSGGPCGPCGTLLPPPLNGV